MNTFLVLAVLAAGILNLKWSRDIMATVKDLNDKLDAMTAAVAAERAEVLAKLKEIRDSIPAGPASQADLDALGARLDDQIGKVQGIIDASD